MSQKMTTIKMRKEGTRVKHFLNFKLLILILFSFSCESLVSPVKEMPNGYQIQKGTDLSVILETPLSSSTNQRGDQFIALLKEPIIFKNEVILPKDTQIKGLVKRVKKYEKLGDRAGLILLFDQVGLPNGEFIPLAASLDTDRGEKAIKIKGKELQDAKVVGGSAIVGALVGRAALGKKGTGKGLLVGAAAGTGAVILSNRKEVKLPQGTELIIKLDEPLLIPK